jgi:lipid-binding SYLF domain-containing protein
METKIMKTKSVLITTTLAALGLATAVTALAVSKSEINERVAAAVGQFQALNPANKTLGDKSAGMLIFPRVTKGGVGVAAEYGEGVLQIDGKTVGYYSVGAASVGLTVGIAQHSEIIMFMTKDSLADFRATKGWSIGANAGITVVNAGASGEYDSKLEQKPILGFIYGEKGLIADLSFEGEKISTIKSE